MVEVLAKYPAATVIFLAWPLLFVWLLVWTVKQSELREQKSELREQKLMAVNEEWRKVVENLTAQVAGISQTVEQIQREIGA